VVFGKIRHGGGRGDDTRRSVAFLGLRFSLKGNPPGQLPFPARVALSITRQGTTAALDAEARFEFRGFLKIAARPRRARKTVPWQKLSEVAVCRKRLRPFMVEGSSRRSRFGWLAGLKDPFVSPRLWSLLSTGACDPGMDCRRSGARGRPLPLGRSRTAFTRTESAEAAHAA